LVFGPRIPCPSLSIFRRLVYLSETAISHDESCHDLLILLLFRHLELSFSAYLNFVVMFCCYLDMK
jgi:hypothetical protein